MNEADAIYLKLEAQARGAREILVKQAEGLASLVSAGGGDPKMAAMLMITDKLPELVGKQVEAVSNLKIDKVVVWDSLGGDGTPSTAKYLSGLVKSLPPLQNLFEMAGMKLPDLLDVQVEQTAPAQPLEPNVRNASKGSSEDALHGLLPETKPPKPVPGKGS